MSRDPEETYVKVMVLENEIEAHLLDSILTQRKIPHLMRSYHDTAYDGLYQAQKGWGTINAPESFHQEINEIITDLRNQAHDFNETP